MSAATYTLLGLMLFELGIVLAKNGQPRGPYSFGWSLLSAVVLLTILYWGGFFARSLP